MPTINKSIPTNQSVYINSSQGRIFDFNTPSSRVYLGEAVNSLLKVFGDNNIISGFRILDISYHNDIVTVKISPGEAILDSTLIKYNEPITLKLDVSGLDDRNGSIIVSMFFNFVQTQQKNLSSIKLTYVTNDGHVPDNSWFSEFSNIVIAKINFNKELNSAVKEIIPVLNRQKITIENQEYVIYPADNISKRILLYLNDVFV